MNTDENFECTCERCSAPVDGEMHSCPFQSDVYDNHEAGCNCCAACEHECCMDI